MGALGGSLSRDALRGDVGVLGGDVGPLGDDLGALRVLWEMMWALRGGDIGALGSDVGCSWRRRK